MITPSVEAETTSPETGGPDWSRLLAARASRGGGELTAILSLADSRDVIAFSGGFPAPETFPVDVLHELTTAVLEDDPARALQYTPTEGLASVRATIADLVRDYQGTTPDPDGVLVTSGGIEAMQLLARTLIDPGDPVLVEAPTYLGAIMAFAGFEAQVSGIGMDADGLRVDELEAALRRGIRPKLLYTIPDHQNPTGLTLSADRRRDLVDVCRRYGVLIVEDVAYRELGFDGPAVTSLWSLAPDLVMQIGTFSKIFMPGVRLGWAIGPRPLVDAMAWAKQNSDQCAGALGQQLMERYVRGGHLEPHLVKARALYRARAETMAASLEKEMPPGVTWTTPRGGFFTWLTGDPSLDTRALVPAARRLRVAYVPGAPFYPDTRGANEMRLSFSRTTEADIVEGVGRLGELFREQARSR